ncbi:hypothetical protein ACTHPF_11935 [Paenibacillus sp. SAF-054]|uniref:hypothetical protein n=1 Tax=unclassified Paenibacillus TaxID=185978 RepID=UPI003F817D3D
MAETLNYRMNLVVEPKNIVKANRELRAMERYFERIQGRVLRIGRTRMAPEIVLKDRASAGLDGILGRINKVKSQIVQASGTVTLKVRQEQTKEQSSGKKHAMKVPPAPKMVLIFPDFSPIIQAVNTNSVASMLNSRLLVTNAGYLANLANALNSIKVGGSGPKEEEKPKSLWEKFKSGVSFAKNATATVKGITDTPEKAKEVWKHMKPDGGSTTKSEKLTSMAKNMWKNKKNLGKSSVDLFSTLTETLEGGTGVADSVMGLFSGGSSGSSKAITESISEVAGSGSGIAGKLLKAGGKRMFPVAGYALDAINIVKAKPGKERAQAIGSAAGGTLGSVVGGALGTVILPGIGSVVGSTLGGMAGDLIGGKLGGMVSDQIPKIKDSFNSVKGWFSKTFSGKKDKPKDKEDISKKPDVITAPYNPEKQPLIKNAPYMPDKPPAIHTAPLIQGPQLQYSNPNMFRTGPGLQSNVTNNGMMSGGKMPQIIQISPEQMTAFSGLLQDFKTETTVNYNLPPGAVQVTVHEEHPIDVEGLIQQIGQRLRAEFQKAAQNKKPMSVAYA